MRDLHSLDQILFYIPIPKFLSWLRIFLAPMLNDNHSLLRLSFSQVRFSHLEKNHRSLICSCIILGLSLLILFHLDWGTWQLEGWLRDELKFPVTFHWPAVVLAQFSVSCALAIRTMRVAFDQINPRAEDVARTLGCTRGQAFVKIALPQAVRGMIAATTIAWARALGEFGPILVFAGSTRMRTEVLSTTVFLELSVGRLDAAVAVSLLMVGLAIVVLLILRGVGMGMSGADG